MDQNKPNKDIELTAEIVEAYLKGTLSAEMKEKVEQFLAANPFEADAIQGLSTRSTDLVGDLGELNTRLENRLAPYRKKWYQHYYWPAAAALLLLVISGLIFYLLPPAGSDQIVINQQSDQVEPVPEPALPESDFELNDRANSPKQSIEKLPEQTTSESETEEKPPVVNAEPSPPVNRQPATEEIVTDQHTKLSPDVEVNEEAVIEDVVFEEAPAAGHAKELNNEQRYRTRAAPVAPSNDLDSSADNLLRTTALPPDHWDDYLSGNMQLPESVRSGKVAGSVTLQFQVSERGIPSQIEVISRLCDPCDREAVRLIEEGPLWTPAILNGTPINSMVEFEIKFQPVNNH